MPNPSFHFVLVCHAELGLDGTWTSYDRVQPAMEGIFDRVAQATGKPIRSTYCLTSEFIADRLEEAARLLEAGHEIGVHSHLPGSHRQGHRYDGPYRLKTNAAGELNQDRVAGPLRESLIARGFPPPRTHVSGMFSFQPTTIRLLEAAGFENDCSLIPNGKVIRHSITGAFVIADNRRRMSRAPYFPDPGDPWSAGRSSMVEIPVSGNLGMAYFGIDWAQSLEEELALIAQEPGAPGTPRLYQSYWHHFEFDPAHSWTRGSLLEAERFLTALGCMPGVQFSTVSEARRAWLGGGSSGRLGAIPRNSPQRADD